MQTNKLITHSSQTHNLFFNLLSSVINTYQHFCSTMVTWKWKRKENLNSSCWNCIYEKWKPLKNKNRRRIGQKFQNMSPTTFNRILVEGKGSRLPIKRFKESVKKFAVTTEQMGPKGINKWPVSLTDDDDVGGDGDQTIGLQEGMIVSELSCSVNPCHVHAG